MCTIADWMILVLLGVCSVSDARKKTMPAVLLILFSIAVVGFALFDNAVSTRFRVGGLFMGILFLLISKCSKEAIGYGDSWLILLLGIYLGYLRALGVLFGASLLAGVVSVLFLWKRGWKKKATLPFVPFLSIAYLGAMIV